MTPLEKAKAEEGRVNYCDECEQFEIVGNAAYCKVDGKLIHPIMMARGQGTGPAGNCKKRNKPVTNGDRIRSMSDEELADWAWGAETDGRAYGPRGKKSWLDWLKEEEHNEIY